VIETRSPRAGSGGRLGIVEGDLATGINYGAGLIDGGVEVGRSPQLDARLHGRVMARAQLPVPVFYRSQPSPFYSSEVLLVRPSNALGVVDSVAQTVSQDRVVHCAVPAFSL
jgi:hypothetical protein